MMGEVMKKFADQNLTLWVQALPWLTPWSLAVVASAGCALSGVVSHFQTGMKTLGLQNLGVYICISPLLSLEDLNFPY